MKLTNSVSDISQWLDISAASSLPLLWIRWKTTETIFGCMWPPQRNSSKVGKQSLTFFFQHPKIIAGFNNVEEKTFFLSHSWIYSRLNCKCSLIQKSAVKNKQTKKLHICTKTNKCRVYLQTFMKFWIFFFSLLPGWQLLQQTSFPFSAHSLQPISPTLHWMPKKRTISQAITAILQLPSLEDDTATPGESWFNPIEELFQVSLPRGTNSAFLFT